MILKQGLSLDDVVLGRGTGSNDHEGNVRFRAIVKQVLRQSSAPPAINCTLNPSNKAACTKSSMAATVLSIVHERGGQFIRKASKVEILAYLGEKANSAVSNADEKMVSSSNWYVIVPRQVALEKAKQSFRHQKRILHSEQERSVVVAKELVSSRNYLAQLQSSFSAGTSTARSSDVSTESSVWNDSCRATLDASPVLQMIQIQAAAAAAAESPQQFHSKLSSQHLMKHTGCDLFSRLTNPSFFSLSSRTTNDSLAMLSSLLSGFASSSSSSSPPSLPPISACSTPIVLGLPSPLVECSTTPCRILPVGCPAASCWQQGVTSAATLPCDSLLRVLRRQQPQEQSQQEQEQAALSILLLAGVQISVGQVNIYECARDTVSREKGQRRARALDSK
ncbi:hypothetical protein IV203_027228 [Nitzschia inconspicua]|uniref:DUF6824 domain-containing protein n=1 Tax=Nitzschia inconspicua TaxID=303405 RepID=A0A9K3LWD5_9STRA|nr:hypothetical protein IV203_027228 [Nitzschia inconspicua]